MKHLALALSAVVVGVVVSSCAVGVRQPASHIERMSATLNGKVLSTTGGPGSYHIEYGPTAARAETTPTRTIDFAVNESHPVSEPVDDLEPGTTYHFAVCAEDTENPGEPFCSPDQTFTTDGEREDFVTGTAAGPFGATGMIHTIDAHSGPAGEDAMGTTSSKFGTFELRGTVICLAVTGSRATIGLAIAGNPADVQAAFIFVEDNVGAEQDRMGFEVLQQLPAGCPAGPQLRPPPITGGDLTVHDEAPAPAL